MNIDASCCGRRTRSQVAEVKERAAASQEEVVGDRKGRSASHRLRLQMIEVWLVVEQVPRANESQPLSSVRPQQPPPFCRSFVTLFYALRASRTRAPWSRLLLWFGRTLEVAGVGSTPLVFPSVARPLFVGEMLACSVQAGKHLTE